jgi:hypothetical protein
MQVQEGTSIRVVQMEYTQYGINLLRTFYYICIQPKEGSLTAYTITDGIISDKTVEW